MTTRYTSGRTSSGSFFTILLSLVLGAAAVVVFLRHATGGIPARLSTLITGRASAADLSVPTITGRLQQLNQFQTVLYAGDVVLEPPATASPALPDTVATDKPLLIAHGEIAAGVDLAHLRPEDLRIDPGTRSIHVHLPASELFSASFDPHETRALSRLTGLPVPAADTTLTPEARTRAQAQLQQAALQSGLLDLARNNARLTITILLRSLGFTEVDVL